MNAFNGKQEEWQWGDGLIDHDHPQLQRDQVDTFAEWRHSGFVFWDEKRARQMQTNYPRIHQRKIGYKAGWLIKLWELEVESHPDMMVRVANYRLTAL